MAATLRYDEGMDDKTKQDIALFRISVLGPLVGAQLDHGDVLALCREAAQRRWEWPDGTLEQIAADTIRGWYYAYRKGGFTALMPRDRKDLGTSDIEAGLAQLIVRAKRERPRRSIKRIIKILVRAGRAKADVLSKSSVHRLLEHHGVSQVPRRGPSAERRSFLYENAGELLVGDALHPRKKVIDEQGRLRKAYLLSQIDGATRYVPESYLALAEDAPAHEKGLKHALRAHGRWLKYYVDLGSAYIARSLRIICGELDMRLLHAGAGDAEAKGVIERWHERWRAEVESELPDYPIPLRRLAEIHQAWLACEYHLTVHETTGRAPRDHWLESCHHLRGLPKGIDLDQLFLHRATRTVNKTGTVRWGGGRLEVSPELCERKVELRFDPSEPDRLPKVFVNGRFVCDTVPLDLYRNAHRRRRRDLGRPDTTVEPTGLDPLGDLVRDHQKLTQSMAHLAEKETHDEDDATHEE